jgi:hypothetical protein
MNSSIVTWDGGYISTNIGINFQGFGDSVLSVGEGVFIQCGSPVVG